MAGSLPTFGHLLFWIWRKEEYNGLSTLYIQTNSVMSVVVGPVDLQLESYVETSIKISNFVERYYAAQNEALDDDDSNFFSVPIQCAYPSPTTSGRLTMYTEGHTVLLSGVIEIRVFAGLLENVSYIVTIYKSKNNISIFFFKFRDR